MKKTLLALSMSAMMFVGCGDKLSDEAVKNYENTLNEKLKEAKDSLFILGMLTGTAFDIQNDKYTCENKGDYANCVNPSVEITANINGVIMKAISLKGISTKTNMIYSGKAQENLNMKDAIASMPKELFNDSKVESITISPELQGLLTALSLSEASFADLAKFASDDYSISLNTKANDVLNQGEFSHSAKIVGNKYNNSLDFKIDGKMLKGANELLGKMAFDGNNIEQLASTLEPEVLNDVILLKAINSKLSVKSNVDFIDRFGNIDNYPEPFNKIFKDFVKNFPHELNFELATKNDFNIIENINNYHTGKTSLEESQKLMKENLKATLNGVDLTKIY